MSHLVFSNRLVSFINAYKIALTNGSLINKARQGAFAIQRPDDFSTTSILKEHTHYIEYNESLRTQTLNDYLAKLPQRPLLISIEGILDMYRNQPDSVEGKIAINTLNQILEHDKSTNVTMGILLVDTYPMVTLLYKQYDIPGIWFPETAEFKF